MTTITYEFEELAPYKDMFVLVAGRADIRGSWDGPDKDVGIMCGGWDYDIDAIYIDSLKSGEPAIQIGIDHPLYDLIEKQLLSDEWADSIRGELEYSSTPYCEYERD